VHESKPDERVDVGVSGARAVDGGIALPVDVELSGDALRFVEIERAFAIDFGARQARLR